MKKLIAALVIALLLPTVAQAVTFSSRFRGGTITGPVTGADGTVTAPSYSFSADTNTGLYRVGTDTLGVATNGTLQLSIGTSRVFSALQFQIPTLSAATPSYSFDGDSNTGMYSSGADTLDFSTGGTKRFEITSSGHLLPGVDATYNIGSASFRPMNITASGTIEADTAFSINNDVFLTRDAANVLAQRNSTAAQQFTVYNTFTDSSNYERLSIGFVSNVATIKAVNAGTGTSRALALQSSVSGNTATLTINRTGVPFFAFSATATSVGGSITTFVYSSSSTATAVTAVEINPTYNPTATSTAVVAALKLSPVINYSAGTPGAGSYEALKIAATETALPTGQSYLIRASAGAAGTSDIYRVTNGGVQIQAQATADPGTGIMSVSDMAIYRKNNKIVIAYNNGGTMTYATLPLDATTVLWTQSTTAP